MQWLCVIFYKDLKINFVLAAVEKSICPVNEDSIPQLTFKVREEQIQLKPGNPLILTYLIHTLLNE